MLVVLLLILDIDFFSFKWILFFLLYFDGDDNLCDFAEVFLELD